MYIQGIIDGILERYRRHGVKLSSLAETLE